jgi:hypothetical protein
VSSLERFPALATFLKGDAARPSQSARWAALGMSEDEVLNFCASQDLAGLMHQRLSESVDAGTWPARVRDVISGEARVQAAQELLRAAEIRAVIDALAHAAVPAVLVKGTPLAYSVYDTPASRPRSDTDLLVPTEAVNAAREVFAARDYRTTVHCNELFSQFEVQKEDGFGVLHVFDVHWKISTQPVFADVLSYDELRSRVQPVAALGSHALAPGPVDALLLACIHPVMHHRNVERALWRYDVHLLASRLTPTEFEQFVRLAQQKKMAAVCAHQLRLAQDIFGTACPPGVVDRLSASGRYEPSAEYLDEERRWHDEMISSVRGLSSLRDRMRLLREVLFPGPRYMLGAYGLSRKPLAVLLLPALYVHRNAYGAWKILSGRK